MKTAHWMPYRAMQSSVCSTCGNEKSCRIQVDKYHLSTCSRIPQTFRFESPQHRITFKYFRSTILMTIYAATMKNAYFRKIIAVALCLHSGLAFSSSDNWWIIMTFRLIYCRRHNQIKPKKVPFNLFVFVETLEMQNPNRRMTVWTVENFDSFTFWLIWGMSLRIGIGCMHSIVSKEGYSKPNENGPMYTGRKLPISFEVNVIAMHFLYPISNVLIL